MTLTLKKGHKSELFQKENMKILPLNQLSDDRAITNEAKPELAQTEVNPNPTPRNGFSNPPAQGEDNPKLKKSRNRSRYDLTKPIIEHEEEAKGTIDFKNRRQMREETKGKPFVSYRQPSRDLLNDSSQPFVQDVDENEEAKSARGGDESIDNALRMINMSENHCMDLTPQMGPPEGGAQSAFEEQEEEKVPPGRNLDSFSRKRSISAQEPLRKNIIDQPKTVRNQVNVKNNLMIKRNNLVKNTQRDSPLELENDEDIDELINDFSQDLERRQEAEE